MTTKKPRTEIPKITPKRQQTFILSHEELLQACAKYIIATRSNCEYNPADYYQISGILQTYTITLTDMKK